MAKFEDNLTSLETVVEKLERGDLSLEDSVKLFEEGIRLSSACKAELDMAEGRIQVLIEQGSSKMRVADIDVKSHAASLDDEEDR